MREEPFLIEKIVAALSYLTMGMAGFIWLLISLFTKVRLKSFLQYHIFQSISDNKQNRCANNIFAKYAGVI